MWTRMYNGFINISSGGFSKMTLGIGPVGGLWVIGLSPFRMVTVGPPFLQTILAGSASCTRASTWIGVEAMKGMLKAVHRTNSWVWLVRKAWAESYLFPEEKVIEAQGDNEAHLIRILFSSISLWGGGKEPKNLLNCKKMERLKQLLWILNWDLLNIIDYVIPQIPLNPIKKHGFLKLFQWISTFISSPRTRDYLNCSANEIKRNLILQKEIETFSMKL